MSRKNLIIVGAGGFGRELHAMLWEVFSPAEFQFGGFLADETSELARELGPLVGSPREYVPRHDDRFLLAVGHMEARVGITAALWERGGQFISFVHPHAYIARSAVVGTGAIIYPFAVVSNRARLADAVHLNYYASVGHDASVGRCCLLAPYATLNGMTSLDDHVYLSTHATVVVGKHVGAGSKVSANSTVQHNVPPGSLVFGVPGRVLPTPSGLG